MGKSTINRYLTGIFCVGSGSEEDDFEDALDYQEKITIPSPVQQPNHRYTAATALIINSFH